MVSKNHSLFISDLIMAHTRRQDAFDDSDYASCPAGGDWWKCEDVNYPTFIGCCSSNPCSGQMCPEGDLYPMGFGSITAPASDYPNHSCPYNGLWYTCADNIVTFQGCCESDPCNGQGCPASDLRPAGVHTVIVAGTSTFTVPPSVATEAPTSVLSASVTTTSNGANRSSTPVASQLVSAQPVSKSIDTAAIAGGSAAVAAVVTIVIGLTIWSVRRRRTKRVAEFPHKMVQHLRNRSRLIRIPSVQVSACTSRNVRSLLTDLTTVTTPLPRYTQTIPSFTYQQSLFSPAPTYQSTQTIHPPHAEPQEVMGLGLSQGEFNRRTKSRSPVNHLISAPIELATQRFSAGNPDAEAKSPLLESKSNEVPQSKPRPNPNPNPNPNEKRERQSRLRARPAMVDLRAEASRSPSRGPTEGLYLDD